MGDLRGPIDRAREDCVRRVAAIVAGATFATWSAVIGTLAVLTDFTRRRSFRED